MTGIIAREIRDDSGVRQGFTSGPFGNPELCVIAKRDFESDARVSSYGVDLLALDEIAGLLAEQLAVAQERNLVLVFDEVGLMQAFSARLRRQIEDTLKSDVPSIMTIKQDDTTSEWLKEVKKTSGIRLVTVTEETRDEVLTYLKQYIEEKTIPQD